MVNIFKKFTGAEKENENTVVSCEDAKDLLLSRTGLRITCPDEDDANEKLSYDEFVKATDQQHAEQLLKKHKTIDCEDAKKIVHEKLGVQYICPEEKTEE